MATTNKTIKIKQVGSAIRRRHDQRETLVGLGLNRVGRVSEVQDTPSARGMMSMKASETSSSATRTQPASPRRILANMFCRS